MPELDSFIRYCIGYGTLQPCLCCQRPALLRGVLRRENPTYNTYWRYAARANRGFKMILFTEPSEDLCRRKIALYRAPFYSWFLILFSYDCSLEMLFFFVWILLLSGATSLQSLGRFYEPPGMWHHDGAYRLYCNGVAVGPCIRVSLYLHRVTQKTSPLMFDNNFGKCRPIFKILSPGDL